MNRAIGYAEDTLGVHRLWLDTQQLSVQLNDLYQMMAGYTMESRKLDYEMENAKNTILARESEQNESMTPTAFERHMKVIFAADPDLAIIRKLQMEAMGRRDAAEASVKSVERNHNGHVARLRQLGGYLNYLAVAKSAQISASEAMTTYPF